MAEQSVASRLIGGDHTLIELRVDYARTRADLDISDGTAATACRKLVHDIAVKLGHTALRQGNRVECAKCGMSGTAGAILTGDVFWWTCGEQITPFGHEKTAMDFKRRALYERSCARELRARGGVGDEALAVGHDNAAKAYEVQAKRAGKDQP